MPDTYTCQIKLLHAMKYDGVRAYWVNPKGQRVQCSITSVARHIVDYGKEPPTHYYEGDARDA